MTAESDTDLKRPFFGPHKKLDDSLRSTSPAARGSYPSTARRRDTSPCWIRLDRIPGCGS